MRRSSSCKPATSRSCRTGTSPAQAEWHVAMRRCVALLTECDGVCLLPGWRGSRGAQTEYLLAMRLDMDVRELSRWTG